MTQTMKILATVVLVFGLLVATSGLARADGPFIPIPIPVPVPLFSNPAPGGVIMDHGYYGHRRYHHGPRYYGPPPPPPRRYHHPRRRPDRVRAWPPVDRPHGYAPRPNGPRGYPPGW